MSEPEAFSRFYRACGHTIRAWAEFEITLLFYFNALMPVDQFRCRTVWLRLPTYQARKEMIRILALVYVDTAAMKKLDNFLNRASGMAAKRNMIAHTLGGVDSNTGNPFFTSDEADKELGINFLGRKDFNWANIENWPSDIKQLQAEMMAWINDFAANIAASPKMHRLKPDAE